MGKRVFSLSSLQPLGWMEGCVLDGLYTLHESGNLHALKTIRSHMGKYVLQKGIFYPRELVQELGLIAEITSNSLRNGLCPVFLGEEETGKDTSSSAGIAAALSLGIKYGLLDPEYRQIISRTYKRLTSYLTPDGMLCGHSQSNKGGEQLQRSGYRIISPMAMGLMAHILCIREAL